MCEGNLLRIQEAKGMFKIDIVGKQLIALTPLNYCRIGGREDFTVEDWVEASPSILNEDLLLLAKRLVLPSLKCLDLLGLDRGGNLVLIQIGRDQGVSDNLVQMLKHAAYLSGFTANDIVRVYAQTLQVDPLETQRRIEVFISTPLDMVNQGQRIIFVASAFDAETLAAIHWLRAHYRVGVTCVQLRLYFDKDGELFVTTENVPLQPEARRDSGYVDFDPLESPYSHTSSCSPEGSYFEQPERVRQRQATLWWMTNLSRKLQTYLHTLFAEVQSVGLAARIRLMQERSSYNAASGAPPLLQRLVSAWRFHKAAAVEARDD